MEKSRVVYVFALPKSGSRLLYRTVLDAQPKRRAIPLHHPAMARNVAHAVNMEAHYHYLSQLDEGLLHSHASPLPYNFVVLRDLGIRHVVTMRHPADHLVALYCHLRNLLVDAGEVKTMPPAQTTKPVNPKGAPSWHSVIFPVHEEYIRDGVSLEGGLNHLIRDGYLTSALKWMADWLLFADGLSLVIRYEDLLASPSDVFHRVYTHLIGAVPAGVPAVLPDPPQYNPVAYPKGYSGESGVWREYFSLSNVGYYNETVASFLAAYAPGSRLSEIYPDIMLSSGAWPVANAAPRRLGSHPPVSP